METRQVETIPEDEYYRGASYILIVQIYLVVILFPIGTELNMSMVRPLSQPVGRSVQGRFTEESHAFGYGSVYYARRPSAAGILWFCWRIISRRHRFNEHRYCSLSIGVAPMDC